MLAPVPVSMAPDARSPEVLRMRLRPGWINCPYQLELVFLRL